MVSVCGGGPGSIMAGLDTRCWKVMFSLPPFVPFNISEGHGVVQKAGCKKCDKSTRAMMVTLIVCLNVELRYRTIVIWQDIHRHSSYSTQLATPAVKSWQVATQIVLYTTASFTGTHTTRPVCSDMCEHMQCAQDNMSSNSTISPSHHEPGQPGTTGPAPCATEMGTCLPATSGVIVFPTQFPTQQPLSWASSGTRTTTATCAATAPEMRQAHRTCTQQALQLR